MSEEQNMIPESQPEALDKKAKICCQCKEILGVFQPPAGSQATKALWLGLLLIIASFGLKHLFFSWSIMEVSTQLKEQKLSTAKMAENADINDDSFSVENKALDIDDSMSVYEIEDEITKLQREYRQKREAIELEYQIKAKVLNDDYGKLEGPINKKYDSQINALNSQGKWQESQKLENEKREKIKGLKGKKEARDKKIAKLNEEKQQKLSSLFINEDNENLDKNYNGEDDRVEKLKYTKKLVKLAQYEDKNDLEDEYNEKFRDAREDQRWGQVDMIGSLQSGLWLKFLLDIFKVIGLLLVVLSTMHIAADTETPTSLKVYALICGSLSFFTCLCLGVLTILT